MSAGKSDKPVVLQQYRPFRDEAILRAMEVALQHDLSRPESARMGEGWVAQVAVVTADAVVARRAVKTAVPVPPPPVTEKEQSV